MSMAPPNPIAHASDTARWVAMYRAMESERPDALFRDPYARRVERDGIPCDLRRRAAPAPRAKDLLAVAAAGEFRRFSGVVLLENIKAVNKQGRSMLRP
jgi:O-methyltransferase involved in polyketide biosynthesis